MKQYTTVFLALMLGIVWFPGCAQQRVDNDFVPVVAKPLFKKGTGPVISIDAGHHNFHTLEDKFAPFRKVAELDGFRVRSVTTEIDSLYLGNTKILVIANALNEKNVDSWQQPVYPAFRTEEIVRINNWVRSGGRLFLIADHMSFSGAAAELAKSFGFIFFDGFALRKPKKKYDVFCLTDKTLAGGALTTQNGQVDSIVTFTGQAFEIPSDAKSVITLDSNYKILLPEIAWEFSPDTKVIPAESLSQLAYCKYGAGKIVVAGEAAMFTAQRVGNNKVGLNAPYAKYNLQLLLNILEWLND